MAVQRARIQPAAMGRDTLNARSLRQCTFRSPRPEAARSTSAGFEISSFKIQALCASVLIFSGARVEFLIHRGDGAADRGVQIRDGLDRLNASEDFAFFELGTHLWQFDKHDIAERMLRIIGDADGALDSVYFNPFMFAGVAIARGIGHKSLFHFTVCGGPGRRFVPGVRWFSFPMKFTSAFSGGGKTESGPRGLAPCCCAPARGLRCRGRRKSRGT